MDIDSHVKYLNTWNRLQPWYWQKASSMGKGLEMSIREVRALKLVGSGAGRSVGELDVDLADGFGPGVKG